MPWFFICQPESDYEMFHEDAFKRFNRHIIEADDLDHAIIKYYSDNIGAEEDCVPEYREEIFAIEVSGPKASYMSEERYNGVSAKLEEEAAEQERAAKMAQYEKLKAELGIKDGEKTIVQIIESERGWGQKVDSEREFNSREEAEEFCVAFNKDNTEEKTPDWYMVARIK